MSASNKQIERLRWQCRRGMLELDLLLLPYLEKKYNMSNETDQRLFEELLTHADQDLYAWLVGKDSPSDDRFKELIQKIRNHATE